MRLKAQRHQPEQNHRLVTWRCCSVEGNSDAEGSTTSIRQRLDFHCQGSPLSVSRPMNASPFVPHVIQLLWRPLGVITSSRQTVPQRTKQCHRPTATRLAVTRTPIVRALSCHPNSESEASWVTPREGRTSGGVGPSSARNIATKACPLGVVRALVGFSVCDDDHRAGEF